MVARHYGVLFAMVLIPDSGASETGRLQHAVGLCRRYEWRHNRDAPHMVALAVLFPRASSDNSVRLYTVNRNWEECSRYEDRAATRWDTNLCCNPYQNLNSEVSFKTLHYKPQTEINCVWVTALHRPTAWLLSAAHCQCHTVSSTQSAAHCQQHCTVQNLASSN